MVIMEMRIEPYDAHQLDAVIRLSLRAWTPVFDSIQNAMDADVYRVFYPDNWRVSQQKAALGCLRCGRHKGGLRAVPSSQILQEALNP